MSRGERNAAHRGGSARGVQLRRVIPLDVPSRDQLLTPGWSLWVWCIPERRCCGVHERMFVVSRWLSVFVITAVLASQITLGQDLLLINGKIFTGNRLQPYAEAVLIRDDNILAVGNQRELTPIANHAQVLDLDDKTLLPGL